MIDDMYAVMGRITEIRKRFGLMPPPDPGRAFRISTSDGTPRR